MKSYYFTDDMRRLLAGAREEARRLNHEYVGTEHILLAYATDQSPSTSRVFETLHLDGSAVRAAIEEIVRPGQSAPAFVKELPYTSRAKKTLEHAMAVVRELGHNHVGVEHMLAGLLRERQGIAAQVLIVRGVTEEQIIAAAAALPSTATRRAPSLRKPSLLARLRRFLRGQP